MTRVVNGPILFTDRLILRPLAAEDAESWYAFCADPETMRYLGGVQSRSMAWRSLCERAGAWQIRGFSMFAVIERASGRWVGRVGPWVPEGWPGTEVGWGLAREFTGKGFAHEAAVATISYAFDVLGWDEVIHTIAPENVASAVLAARLGAVNRGPTRLPQPYDGVRVDRWSQTAAEWRAR